MSSFSSYAVIAYGCASCPKLTCERDGCQTEFCYHCKQIWHPNQTCDMARQQRAQTLRVRTKHTSGLSYGQESGPGMDSHVFLVTQCCSYAREAEKEPPVCKKNPLPSKQGSVSALWGTLLRGTAEGLRRPRVRTAGKLKSHFPFSCVLEQIRQAPPRMQNKSVGDNVLWVLPRHGSSPHLPQLSLWLF